MQVEVPTTLGMWPGKQRYQQGTAQPIGKGGLLENLAGTSDTQQGLIFQGKPSVVGSDEKAGVFDLMRLVKKVRPMETFAGHGRTEERPR
jgi:hypothetical protein